MSMVVLGRVAGIDIERSVRVTYIDWLPMIMERATARKWRVFYLGSRPGVAQRGVAILREKNVGLEMVSRHGFFDPNGAGNDQVLSEIRAFSPDILLVGMGMPRQEHWILDNLDRLGPMAVLPCGASIDYVAGEIPTPPRWTGRIGVEWLYRLVVEPSRLWKRYLLEPWSIVFLMGQHWLNKA
jgi:N-acetylglucosaminyldiphosphoundecaprenol N-acetyl-beta-D-mannosaminyltransferase